MNQLKTWKTEPPVRSKTKLTINLHNSETRVQTEDQINFSQGRKFLTENSNDVTVHSQMDAWKKNPRIHKTKPKQSQERQAGYLVTEFSATVNENNCDRITEFQIS